MCTTGNGATITFATTGSVGRVVSMGGFSESLEDIEDSDLGLGTGYGAGGSIDHMQFCQGRVINHEPFEVVVVFDPRATSGRPTTVPGLGVEELVTVEFPLTDLNNTTKATLSGQGWLTGRSPFTSVESNTRIEGSLTVRFKGGNSGSGNGPAWTTEA